MHVLFLTHSFPRSEGDAAGSFILRLAVALRNEDVKVQVVAPAAEGVPEADEIEGIRVERFRYAPRRYERSEEHTSELQSRGHLVCRLLLEKKKAIKSAQRQTPLQTQERARVDAM